MFLIISPEDVVVYQLYTNLIKKDISYIEELIIYASLDKVQDKESSNSMNLKIIDTFKEKIIMGFLTAGKMRFILMHEGKSEENVKYFFQEVYEYYCKAILNPFIDKESKIFSTTFDEKVKLSLKKHLN